MMSPRLLEKLQHAGGPVAAGKLVGGKLRVWGMAAIALRFKEWI